MKVAGIMLSLNQTTLTNWIRKAIDLLRSICPAQCSLVLESRVMAMDEAGIRAGRVPARCSKRSSGPHVDVPCGASGDLNQLLEPFCTR